MVKLKKRQKLPWAEIIIVGLMLIMVGFGAWFIASNMKATDYVVETNAFFAPFEYYSGGEIVGVDVEIINKVAKKLNKTIDIKNVEFDVIIDNVEVGKIADAGAAGLTITPARLEKVNFSIPYYTSKQFVIYAKAEVPDLREGHMTWNMLAGSTVGSQMGSTGYLFAQDEMIEGEVKGFDSHQLAADAIAAHIVKYVICDELAANFIVLKNPGLASAPLYYEGATVSEDFPVEESYAIAVNKEQTELLEAFNEVLAEMTKKDPKGISEIDRLVNQYYRYGD